MEEKIEKVINESELAYMAKKHFDSESVELMIEELKIDILKLIKEDGK